MAKGKGIEATQIRLRAKDPRNSRDAKRGMDKGKKVQKGEDLVSPTALIRQHP